VTPPRSSSSSTVAPLSAPLTPGRRERGAEAGQPSGAIAKRTRANYSLAEQQVLDSLHTHPSWLFMVGEL